MDETVSPGWKWDFDNRGTVAGSTKRDKGGEDDIPKP
jgi:hypothetical protein